MVFIIIITLIAIGLIVIIIVRPGITEVKGGKLVAFLAFLILPVIAILMGTTEHLEKSKSIDFCLSCHAMEAYGESLYVDDRNYLPANHFQNKRVSTENACVACHSTYTLYGGIQDKLRGLKHEAVNYFGKIPEEIELYKPYNNRECLYCHGGARSYDEFPIHSSMVAELKNGDVSCLDCHVLIHNVAELESLDLWKRGN